MISDELVVLNDSLATALAETNIDDLRSFSGEVMSGASHENAHQYNIELLLMFHLIISETLLGVRTSLSQKKLSPGALFDHHQKKQLQTHSATLKQYLGILETSLVKVMENDMFMQKSSNCFVFVLY